MKWLFGRKRGGTTVHVKCTDDAKACYEAFMDSRNKALNTDWFTFQIAWAYARDHYKQGA
ncbi:hypothetical protein WM40_24975 [Robbsia andropogonis]|uniref:Uncharacterized protein n=1 Tax=Robbsia andropogonis TaxID=28092 RepID=A0A0F5JUZ9_9BURK|nr:hypothetical protein [Robbsia andropogonis]KKB61127.1 hypothetical protein WM40_24975 [Robbsia andropogonis]